MLRCHFYLTQRVGIPAFPAVSRPPISGFYSPLMGQGRILTFSDDCWTEVSVDGRIVAAELFRKGTKRQF